MKILFINRSLQFGGFSFEELFTTIKSNLTNCNFEDYYDGTHAGFLKNIKTVKKIKADVYHITGGIGYYALFLPKKKTIFTIHDTNHYEHDLKGLKKWVFGFIFYRIPIWNVRFITVVSEHTKLRLIALFNVPKEKIKVIPNCYPDDFKTNLKEHINATPKILHIGTKPNKNLNRLINSLKGLNIELTIIGELPKRTTQLLKDTKTNYINKTNLTREEVYLQYLNCDMIAFVSLREGFGLPIVEANSVGRAIVTSNISSMPEVAGDAALLVDPYNEKKIRDAFQQLITDKTVRNNLIEKGLKNIERYHPTVIGQLYTSLYQEIVNN